MGPRISLLYESDFHSVETNGLPAGKKKKKKLVFSSSPQLFFPWGVNFAFLLPLLAAHAPKRRGDGRSFLTSIIILFHFFFSGSLLTLRLSASIRWRREARDFDVRLTSNNEYFFSLLLNKYPELSPVELKLCAYLRLNPSTKDLALITNRSMRTIESTRTNIRKKMNLTSQENLVTHLLSFSNE